MEKDAAYDTAEATALLVRLRADLRPHDFYKKREEALWKLVEGVVHAAKHAGYEAGKERGFLVVSLPKSGSVELKVEDDKFTMFNPGPPRTPIPMKITYDAADQRFVGEDVDKDHVPVPGERLGKKRNAVTVVVEVIADAIRVQHEARKNAR